MRDRVMLAVSLYRRGVLVNPTQRNLQAPGCQLWRQNTGLAEILESTDVQPVKPLLPPRMTHADAVLLAIASSGIILRGPSRCVRAISGSARSAARPKHILPYVPIERALSLSVADACPAVLAARTYPADRATPHADPGRPVCGQGMERGAQVRGGGGPWSWLLRGSLFRVPPFSSPCRRAAGR